MGPLRFLARHTTPTHSVDTPPEAAEAWMPLHLQVVYRSAAPQPMASSGAVVAEAPPERRRLRRWAHAELLEPADAFAQ